jgi:hypothetical protein
MKTKFCDFTAVRTLEFTDATKDDLDSMANILQCYYLDTDRILHTIQSADIVALHSGQLQTSFVSFYLEQKHQLMLSNNMLDVESKLQPIACISARSAALTLFNQEKNQTNPIYFVDLLSVHREKDRKTISRKLLQTHEYNQRIQNPTISISLLKKEIELFDGVRPLTTYATMTFYLRNIHFPPLPPHHEVLQITEENLDIVIDYLHLLENTTNQNLFHISVIPNIGNIVSQIKQKLLFIYCLRSRQTALGIYFLKDAKMRYEDIDGNSLQLTCSISNTTSTQLFYLGFLHGLKQLIHKYPDFNMILMEDIGDNTAILHHWREKHTPVFINKTAYYLFNYIMPGSPIAREKCLILL